MPALLPLPAADTAHGEPPGSSRRRGMRGDKPRGSAWVVSAVFGLAVGWFASCCAAAGEFELRLDRPEQTFTVDNPGPPVAPTIYLVGQPDRSAKPVRKTRGVRLGGVLLTETLLSESVLILRPDGSGNWGYHAGFDIFRQPHFVQGKPVDPRTLVEYDKWRYDPLEPVRCVGGDMNLLALTAGGRGTPALYEIAFPSPIRMRSLEVRSNCDQLRTPGVRIAVRLFADRQRKELIAEKHVGPAEQAKRFPVRFEALDRARVFLELSAQAPKDTPVYLYWTFFEADLDATGLNLPELATGRNEWTIADAPDSSHRLRLVLRWQDRPPPERVWDDFEGALAWSGCKQLAGGPTQGLAFTGKHFARATFPANGRDFGLNRSLKEIDLTGYNHLGVAVRAPQPAPMRGILLGIKNTDTGYQYVHLRPGAEWSFRTFDISRFRRDRVVAMNVYWVAMPGVDRPDKPCVYDVDTLCLWHQAPKPPAKRALPEKIAGYRSPRAGKTPRARRIGPVQEWFPMGVYDGICSRPDRECEWMLDEMKRLGMNTVYVSNGSLEGLQRVLPLAEARGIRLIHQGGSDGSLYYLHLATPEARRRSLARVILPRAEEWVPKFRGRWGLLAWSLTEEIGPELSRELEPYYRLVRKLDPEHPPTVLHNNLAAAGADLATNRPLVITHDFYPFFWSPQSGPSNPTRSLAAYRGRVAGYYRACRQHGASLWMMPQAWGQEETAPLDPPGYGYRRGMRTPAPGEIKLQGWVAVAEGATGIMFYATVATRPGQHHLWDLNWTETSNTRAAGQLFTRLRRVAPLLCRLERDYGESGFVSVTNPKILAHTFAKRPDYAGDKKRARYVVLASLDGFGPQPFDLAITPPAKVYDLVARQEITNKLTGMNLPAGEGTVLLIGTKEAYQADCRMIEEELRAWE